MPKYPLFTAGAYQSQSQTVAADECINWYPEAVESGSGENTLVHYPTPGLHKFILLPTAPLRGLWPGENRLFAAAGSKLYEIFSGAAGTVTTAGTAVTWVSGSTFGPGMVGQPITINSVVYTVATVPTMFSLTLTTSAGTQSTAVAYSIAGLAYYTQRGDIGDDAVHSPVEMFPNGQQLFIVSAGNAYCDNGLGPVQPLFSGSTYTDLVIDGTTNTKITSAANPFTSADVGSNLVVTGGTGFTHQTVSVVSVAGNVATMSAAMGTLGSTGGQATQNFGPVTAGTGAFLDTFFIVSKPGTNQIFISASQDGTTWNPGDTASKEGYPDAISSINTDHEELYIFGTHFSAEVWRNEGNPGFPFQRDPGAFLHHAIASPWARNSLADCVFFLAGDTRGRVVAMKAQGFQAGRISTHAMEQRWGKYTDVHDAITYAYQENGHDFWVVIFPTGGEVWVYDVTSSFWHRRCWLNPATGLQERHRARCHAFVAIGASQAQHYVGDYATGDIYISSIAFGDDYGGNIQRRRVAPHLVNESKHQFPAELQLKMDTGATGATSQPILEISRDGGFNYGNPKHGRGRKVGNKQYPVVFARLGHARDFTPRITITDQLSPVMIDAYLLPAEGT